VYSILNVSHVVLPNDIAATFSSIPPSPETFTVEIYAVNVAYEATVEYFMLCSSQNVVLVVDRFERWFRLEDIRVMRFTMETTEKFEIGN
jgi:hypothetical protein